MLLTYLLSWYVALPTAETIGLSGWSGLRILTVPQKSGGLDPFNETLRRSWVAWSISFWCSNRFSPSLTLLSLRFVGSFLIFSEWRLRQKFQHFFFGRTLLCLARR